MPLSKDEILKLSDSKIETLDVPEWGGSVCIRVMTAADRDRFEQTHRDSVKSGNVQNVRARFAYLVLCDEKGNRLFDEADIEALGKKSYHAMQRIFDAGIRLNAMGAEQIEALEKNS